MLHFLTNYFPVIYGGPIFVELSYKVNHFATQNVRIYLNGSDDLQQIIEYRYDVGPLPPHIEVVTRFGFTKKVTFSGLPHHVTMGQFGTLMQMAINMCKEKLNGVLTFQQILSQWFMVVTLKIQLSK